MVYEVTRTLLFGSRSGWSTCGLAEGMIGQQCGSADKEGIGNVEVGPGVLVVVAEQNPIADSMDRGAVGIVKTIPHPVIEVSKNSARHLLPERNGEQQIASGFKIEQPTSQFPIAAAIEKNGEEAGLSLSHAKQRAMIQRCFETKEIFDDPPNFSLAEVGRQNGEDPGFGQQVDRESGDGDRTENGVAAGRHFFRNTGNAIICRSYRRGSPWTLLAHLTQ